MAQEFHLKLITERAGGGDPIVRERHLPQQELSIGRAADSDIVLTDLTIDPLHAKMRFSGPGRVTIESVSGRPFLVGGKSVQRADIDVANHPVVMFASYSLAFDAGPRADEWSPSPTRARAPSDAVDLRCARRCSGGARWAWVFGSAIF